MSESPHTLALIQANKLQADGLNANRSGLLTSSQIQELRTRRSSTGKVLIGISLLCIGFGGWSLIAGPSESAEGGRLGAATLLIAGIAILALRFSNFGKPLTAELSAGRVSSVDGSIQIRHSTSSGESGVYHSYYYQIEAMEFETNEEGANLIQPAERYRIYYVPGPNIMVNIERLEKN